MSGLTRRQALVRGGGAAAAMLVGAPAATHAAKRIRPEALLRGGAFGLGVSAGAPTTDGAVLWTRVDGIERSGRVLLEVARDPDFRQVVERRLTRAASVRDFCTRAKVSGLPPGEELFYRFATRTTSSPVGRFRTLRPADSRETTRIGFFSCQKWHQGHFAAHRALAAEPDLDLVVALGDYVYEEPTRGDVVRPDTTGAERNGDVQTLAEYQEKYRLYKSDPALQAMHAAHPYVAIWDDHEAEDDYAGENEGDPLRPRRISFAGRKRAGYEAFFQYHPTFRDADDRSRIYRTIRLGGADLLLTDQRQYRDALACAPLTPCPQGSAPGRSILGRTQREWLLRELEASRAPWKVLASSVMFAGLDLPTGLQINADQWDGYADERRVIGERLLARGVRDVTTITGDIHTFFAGTVTTDGRATGRPFATEFVGGSITSTGISESLGEPEGSPVAATGLRALNPHLAYVDTRERGYGVLELSATEARCTFRAVEDVTKPDSPTRDLAAFRVARGSTVVEQR